MNARSVGSVIWGVGVVVQAIAVLALGGYDDPQGETVAKVGLAVALVGLLVMLITWWRSRRGVRP